jgi:hypothetical protein
VQLPQRDKKGALPTPATGVPTVHRSAAYFVCVFICFQDCKALPPDNSPWGCYRAPFGTGVRGSAPHKKLSPSPTAEVRSATSEVLPLLFLFFKTGGSGASDVGFRHKHAISVLYTPLLFSGMLEGAHGGQVHRSYQDTDTEAKKLNPAAYRTSSRT